VWLACLSSFCRRWRICAGGGAGHGRKNGQDDDRGLEAVGHKGADKPISAKPAATILSTWSGDRATLAAVTRAMMPRQVDGSDNRA